MYGERYMPRLHLFVYVIIAFVLYGCGNQLTELTKDPNCSTTIEGNFISEPVYKYYSPAIVFPDKTNKADVLGKVVGQDSAGFYLQTKGSGLLSTRDTLYFKFKDIRAVVDSTRHCVWGTLTDKEKAYTNFKVSLKNLDNESYSPLFFTWNSSSNFSYCAEPGHYEITEIIEVNPEYSQDITYESIPKRIAKFEVLAGKANYIGNITLKSLDQADTNSFFVPFKKQDSGGNSAVLGQMLFGVAGVAVMAIVTSAVNASRGQMNCFVFNIDHDPQYQTMSKNPLVNTEVIPIIETK